MDCGIPSMQVVYGGNPGGCAYASILRRYTTVPFTAHFGQLITAKTAEPGLPSPRHGVIWSLHMHEFTIVSQARLSHSSRAHRYRYRSIISI